MILSDSEALIWDFYKGKEREAMKRLVEFAGSDAGSAWFAYPYPKVPHHLIAFRDEIVGRQNMEMFRTRKWA